MRHSAAWCSVARKGDRVGGRCGGQESTRPHEVPAVFTGATCHQDRPVDESNNGSVHQDFPLTIFYTPLPAQPRSDCE